MIKKDTKTVIQDETATLSFAEKVASLQLAKTHRIGGVSFYKILNTFGNAIDSLKYANEYLPSKNKVSIYPEEKILAELEKLKKFNAGVVIFGEKNFPEYLSKLAVPVTFLEYKGDIELIKEYQHNIAVVGARQSSINGLTITDIITRELVKENTYHIVSGLALGIDSAAYNAALPKAVIAVVAGGINHVYPPQNTELQKKILQHHGLVVSEQFLDSSPQADLFPKRNRIIVATAAGVVIVEATLNSGTMITAHEAIKQHKPIFAVPGHPLDKHSEGANYLIQNHEAYLTASGTDVLKILNKDKKNDLFSRINTENSDLHETNKHDVRMTKTNTVLPKLDDVCKTEAEILKLISYEASNINMVEQELQVDPSTFNITIVRMLISNKVILEGNNITKIYNSDQDNNAEDLN